MQDGHTRHHLESLKPPRMDQPEQLICCFKSQLYLDEGIENM